MKNKQVKEDTGNAVIENAGCVIEQKITRTLEENYMPYAMSVIVSRAIPEIDGFKPSHRKLLYMMYKMGLLGGARTKSANVVGQTMKLNPHGDAAIYETLVRLSTGNEALLHPYIDSKGNFGKSYSRDMAYAASRYTEVKLAAICTELFSDIDKDTTDFVDNYDNKMKEPTLLPVTFPSILVNANKGIAVGMASSICPFHLSEVCETAIALMKNSNHDVSQTLIAPDFPTGGMIVFNSDEMKNIYETGRGGFRVRSKYNFDKSNNCIEVTEIPPSTTVEAIIDKIVDLVKQGKIREIGDIRDETDLHGLKIAIDLKRGIEPEKLMPKLFRFTTLEDTFSCNFNVLIGGSPRVMGVRELLVEWIAFRQGCIKRRVSFDLTKKKEKLHVLFGLSKIILDIDKAIKIVRETHEENEVVPNLMIGFGIDEIQAEYVAEIKLRHLNKEYILKRTKEIESLKSEIDSMQDILENPNKINQIIVQELKQVMKRYSQPRKTLLYYKNDNEEYVVDDDALSYPVNVFFTQECYFKKITPQSLRMSGEHKLKDGDSIKSVSECNNTDELMFFTNQAQVYKTRVSEFEDTKASLMGEYIPVKLGMEQGEYPIYMALISEYIGYMVFFFESGRVAKVEMSSYQTKTKRKKLMNAYCAKEQICAIFAINNDEEFMIRSQTRQLLVHTGMIASKSAKDTLGIQVMKLMKNCTVIGVEKHSGDEKDVRYRPKALPSMGVRFEQASLFDGEEIV